MVTNRQIPSGPDAPAQRRHPNLRAHRDPDVSDPHYRDRDHGDGGHGDGGYSVLEAAITLPVIFFLLMIVVQWAIVWHSRNVAQAAAQEALRGAQSYQATAASGQAVGDNYLAQVAPHALGGNCVTVTRSATTVTVRVHCKVMSVVPFATYYATETVSGPVERYVSVP